MTLRVKGKKQEPEWDAKTVVTIPTAQQTKILLQSLAGWAERVVSGIVVR